MFGDPANFNAGCHSFRQRNLRTDHHCHPVCDLHGDGRPYASGTLRSLPDYAAQSA
jgi:hypothetical protein